MIKDCNFILKELHFFALNCNFISIKYFWLLCHLVRWTVSKLVKDLFLTKFDSRGSWLLAFGYHVNYHGGQYNWRKLLLMSWPGHRCRLADSKCFLETLLVTTAVSKFLVYLTGIAPDKHLNLFISCISGSNQIRGHRYLSLKCCCQPNRWNNLRCK